MERTSLSSGFDVSVKVGTARRVVGVLLKERVVDDVDDDARWIRRAQRVQMDGDAMVVWMEWRD